LQDSREEAARKKRKTSGREERLRCLRRSWVLLLETPVPGKVEENKGVFGRLPGHPTRPGAMKLG